MNRLIAVEATVFAGVIASRSLSPVARPRLGSATSHRMLEPMEHMMASLPEASPPQLVISVLPRLRDQNDELIAVLREDNALLREHLQGPH